MFPGLAGLAGTLGRMSITKPMVGIQSIPNEYVYTDSDPRLMNQNSGYVKNGSSQANDYSNARSSSPAYDYSKARSLNQDKNYQKTNTNKKDIKSVIPDTKTGSSVSRQQQANLNNIGRDWGNMSTEGASSALKSLSGDMGILAKARDEYLRQSEARKLAKENAINENQLLIDKYQSKDLRNLGTQLRDNMMNTNMLLGEAGSGSAGLAAARALARQNSIARSNVLTQYGDEIAKQQQQQDMIEPDYQLERQKAYDWEDRNKKALIENYNIQKKALDRLKSKVPDWKKEDLDNENNNNLKELLSGLSTIEANARSIRDDMYSKYYGMMDSSSALAKDNLGINGPAEANTPDFAPELDMTGLEEGTYDAQDYYNPTQIKKKTGKSIFDNPLVFDENQ